MKYLLIPLLAMLLIPGLASGQEVPKVTKEGKEAFEKLVGACFDGGALKVVKEPDGTEVLAVDESKLRATVAAHPELLTPAWRDAVLASWFRVEAGQKPLFVAILRAYAEQKKDERAAAFAALFTATAERDPKPAAAVRHYQEAVRHFRAAGDVAWQAVCLNDIGLTYHYLADFPRALDYLQQALAAWRQVHDGPHAGTANSLGNMGLAYHDFGDYRRALDYHQQALAMRQQLHDGPDSDVAQSLSNLGAVYHDLGDYATALDYHQQALAMLRKLHDKAHRDIALALDNIGSAYASLGESDRALDSLHQALAMRRKLYDKPHRDIAQSLNNIGAAYQDLGDDAKALDFLQQALAMKRKLYDGPHPDVALTLHDLGAAYSGLEDYSNALDSYQQALMMWRKLHDGHHPDVAASLNNIGAAYRHLGESRKSLQALDEALKVLRPPSAEEPLASEWLQPGQVRPLPLTVMVLGNRGKTLEHALAEKATPAQLRDCESCYALAADVLDRVRQEALGHETSKLFAGAKEVSLTPDRVGLCRRLYELEGDPKDLRTAFHAAEQGRARVFLDALGQARAGLLGGVSPELRQREGRLLFRLRACDLRIEQAESSPGQADTPLPKLWDERRLTEADLQQLVTEMEKEYPRYAALKYPPALLVEEAQACLGPEEVALHFVLGRDVSYVVLLEGKPAPGDRAEGLAIYRLPGSDAIADGVAALVDRDALMLPARVRSLGAELYAQLLEPLASRLRGKDLVIVPDGPLCYLPFELLVEGGDGTEAGHFLVENHRIRYALSLTVLHLDRQWAGKREHQPDRPLWALGDPVYDANDERLRGKPALASATRDAERELLWREGAGRAASPACATAGRRWRRFGRCWGRPRGAYCSARTQPSHGCGRRRRQGELGRARYVHFACHGILGLHDGQPPALVLSLVGNSGKRDEYGVLDGFLRMDEVTNLRLNADLVVLSACKSGQGKLWNGEGVTSLARAFLHAGSRGVVCSLWSVDDRETAGLMAALYGRLKEGGPSANALRDTKLDMIGAGKAPLYWAPFVLIGE